MRCWRREQVGAVEELASNCGTVGKREKVAGIPVSGNMRGYLDLKVLTQEWKEGSSQERVRWFRCACLCSHVLKRVLESAQRRALKCPSAHGGPGERSWFARSVQGDHQPQFLPLQKSEKEIQRFSLYPII